MPNEPKPFLPGEYKPWNFAEFHPDIEKLDMHIKHFQGSPYQTGQNEKQHHFTEKNMPSELHCVACKGGGIDLHRYVQSLEMEKKTEDTTYRNCKGSIGQSPKGRNSGQQCSYTQFNISTEIVYKSKEAAGS